MNTFGQLKLGVLPPSMGGASDLQVVDYSYHIRGGLRGINLDASGNLTNKIFSMRWGYEDAGFWDGNIGKQEWKSNIDNVTRSFTYDYDGASRIKSGIFASTKASENYSLNNVNYDFNGNITNLSRNGWKSNNTFGLVDNLNYTYNSNSNKILKVDDASNETASFRDISGNDYNYNLDGSLNADANKGITSIEYNYLKLPRRIVQNGVTTLYQYSASGAKLREIINTDTTDYLGNVIKKNSALYQISHDEGRVINGEYEYHISDHLGNLRIAFRDSLGVAKITQANSYGIWGEDLPTLSFLKPTWKKDFYKFTGKEELQGTGYTDFGARWYDNLVPRFISVDEKSEKWGSYSPYSYVINNPLKLVDIDGKDIYIWYNVTDQSGNISQSYFRFNGKNADSAPKSLFVQNVLKAYNYNAKNGGGDNGIEAATNSQLAISISDATGVGDYHSDGYVYWNPYELLATDNGLFLSASTALEHELDHAVHTAKYPQEHAKLKKILDPLFTNLEEKRVITGSEKKTATKNKEIKKGQGRNSHGGSSYQSSDPTVNGYIFGQKDYELNLFLNKLLDFNPNVPITFK